MTRGRVVALAAILACLAAALVFGLAGTPSSPTTAAAPTTAATPKADGLAALRARAALQPCPTGISPDLPALTLPCLGGGPAVTLNGKPSGVPTLVNVYGSWCPPCQAEMPLLAAFSKASAGKVALVGVDTEDDQRLALLFAKDVRQTWPAVVDDNKAVLRKYSSGPPVTLFVDRAGQVVHVKIGAFKNLGELKGLTSQYLQVSL
ncbi:MAG: Thiol-disulfide isomerase-like thioredoxin [Frankiales bacterium]|nr:Thiol-disulfide isomerase-like thioredoxin [Frankiales bacterium]